MRPCCDHFFWGMDGNGKAAGLAVSILRVSSPYNISMQTCRQNIEGSCQQAYPGNCFQQRFGIVLPEIGNSLNGCHGSSIWLKAEINVWKHWKGRYSTNSNLLHTNNCCQVTGCKFHVSGKPDCRYSILSLKLNALQPVPCNL